LIPDARLLHPAHRFAGAERARLSVDISGWPELSCWNSAPCARHQGSDPDPLCPACGVILRSHQRVGAAWLYLAGRAFLADSVGTGKTAQVVALIALCRESGELGTHARTVIVCQAALQWAEQLRRMIPSLSVVTLTGTPAQRRAAYMQEWEVAVLGPRTLAPARGPKASRGGDVEVLEHFPLGLLVYDDVDEMRHHDTRVACAVNRLAERAPRVIGLHGTPMQKRLMELHSFLDPVGGRRVLGTPRQFHRQHIISERVFYQAADRFGHQTLRHRLKDTGIRDPATLRWLIAPLVLRRRASDISDVRMPAIVENVVWLDPTPRQRQRYEELREGVLRKIEEAGEQLSHPAAVAHFTHGSQICSGLATLDRGQDDSAKLDWVMDVLDDGDLSDEKVVIFINFTPNVQALSRRLSAAGIGHVLLWGPEADARVREERRIRFLTDPSCRVVVGTTTMKKSLNLQVARHFVAVDTLLNPATMTQLIGRVRRQGSAYESVYLHQLLLRGTQEEGYLEQLQAEQATSDTVWDESGEMFQRWSARDIVDMIVRNGRRQ
jgi:SNF2 family DNA or RNA helicase